MAVRLLGPGDEAALDAFLARHADARGFRRVGRCGLVLFAGSGLAPRRAPALRRPPPA